MAAPDTNYLSGIETEEGANPTMAVRLATLAALVAACLAAELPDQAANLVTSPGQDPLNQVMQEGCRGIYTGRCMKLGLLRLLGRAGGGTYPLTGGLSLHAEPVPPPPATELKDPGRLDAALIRSLSHYLGSLSLNVKIMDSETPLKLASAYYDEPSAGTARRKGGGGLGGGDKGYGGALAAAGLMSGGTMVAVGMAALAAMAGKALMASMMALMLAAVAALKGGGDDKSTTYEVVAKPIYSHSHHSDGHGGYRRSIEIPYSAHDPARKVVLQTPN